MEGLEALEVIITGHKVKSGAVVIPEQPPWGIREAPAKGNRVFVLKTLLTSSSPQQILSQTRARQYANVSVMYPATNGSSTPAVNQIVLGANGVAAYNNNSVGVNQTISGGTVTAIAINGTTTGLTSGVFFVPAGGTVTVTYSVAPSTFTTAGIPVSVPLVGSPVIFGKSEADVQNIITENADNSVIGATFLVPPNEVFHTEGTTELWCACLGPNFPYVSALMEVEAKD